MAFLKASILALVALVSVNAQLTPVAKPSCASNNVLASLAFLPHETYCSLYYQCNQQQMWTMSCAYGTLFDANLQVCTWPNSGSPGVCKNWVCNGFNYPDVCCDKYWTCNSGTNKWTQSSCPANQVFNRNLGQCESPALTGIVCQHDDKCPALLTNNVNNVCKLNAVANSPCQFTGEDAIVRTCAEGTAYSAAVCGCTHSKESCAFRFNMLQNKELDAQCRASYRVEFGGSLQSYSDKLTRYLIQDQDFNNRGFLTNGITMSNAEAVFGSSAVSNAYIYTYYFANNEIRAPTALVMEFRPESFSQGSSFELLTNNFNVDQPECVPTLSVTVRNDGPTNGFNNDVQYTFTVSATGQANQQAVISDLTITLSTNNQINGSYLRFALGMSGTTLSAEVWEQNSLTQVNRVSRNTPFVADALAASKCGLTVGRGMSGRLRQFNVYEGCGNGFATILN